MGLVQARDVGIHGRGTNLVVISIIFTLVAAGFVFGRFFSRMTSGRILHYDDWVILTSLVSEIHVPFQRHLGSLLAKRKFTDRMQSSSRLDL